MPGLHHRCVDGHEAAVLAEEDARLARSNVTAKRGPTATSASTSCLSRVRKRHRGLYLRSFGTDRNRHPTTRLLPVATAMPRGDAMADERSLSATMRCWFATKLFGEPRASGHE